MRLKNKVAVITGGSGGIGKETALRFIEEGAKVVLVDINKDTGEKVALNLREKGGEVMFLEADVTEEEDVKKYVEETVKKHGKIDIFFNNAGIEGDVSTVADYDAEVFKKVLDVNVTGVFLGLKHVLRQMEKQSSGSVINTSSMGGLVAHENFSAYVASKHAVSGLTKVAGIEYGKKGVRVNAICPGPIKTDMVKNAAQKFNPENPQEYYDKISVMVPDGRLGEPEEIANLVVFLGSDEAKYINGAAHSIDGGVTAV
ncbi:SDR family NAD(P)-dependent oxidoreductase [Alteribacillus sp. YIM 98480]|uniref:SDR family NAD(P)-dependent oxidoreductase n=1 Tax=Alteribacillus sp. YIM 98480 TaxID=2606599 RepID=UPI001E2BD90E|nr:glucose 1-dehydrogenase [Alteribacillus sp. YIM 98480]